MMKSPLGQCHVGCPSSIQKLNEMPNMLTYILDNKLAYMCLAQHKVLVNSLQFFNISIVVMTNDMIKDCSLICISLKMNLS